ncbi:molybdopterin dinucleotide binding domain-containing protein, partial [Raoultibacter timonensis]|uniref:molybdopterin dinucleotide binding domain-containing protein n=1 Tax=Raoultibacter timonensis TaxID=1907662 RepID=UPI001CA5B717
RVIDTTGNEAVFKNCAGGPQAAFGLGGDSARLMNLIGGYLSGYGTDSETQAEFAAGYMLCGGYSGGFGADVSFPGYGSAYFGSPSQVAKDADLVVMFGCSAATSRIGGANVMYDFSQARENGARFVWVDVRQGEESSGYPDEWLPIRPGTDGALAAALCYVFITEGFADEEFLHTHCIGYDEETMPDSVKGQNKSYKDYILGTGYDMVPKTPEWASPITAIPVEKIYQLARDIGNAKSCYIGNGVGVQRRQNGETGAGSVMMIPLVSGHWGLPGTSIGLKPKCSSNAIYWPGFQPIENPVHAIIPITKRIEAIERGEEMTALRDGILGVEKLKTNIKFIYNVGTNMLANQNSDVNWAASILEDESKCEYIVGSDWFLTSSMKYCDLILPDIMPQEALRVTSCQTSGSCEQLVYGQKVQDAPGECRSEFDWLSDIADRFGVWEEFTEGGSNPDEKSLAGYEMIRESGMYPDMPSYEEGVEMGVWTRVFDDLPPAYADFRQDPNANPLPTPSGKVEIYSENLQHVAETWELDDKVHDVINPLPMYQPDFEGYQEATDEYPLQVSSWKSKIRYHSKFDQIEVLRQASRHQLWMNPVDAEPRGIETGDMVRVFNDRGELQIEARVTPRIIPGAVAMEEGRNRELNEYGVDVGGCMNTLVSHHWSPLAKHNPSNSVLAQVEKI